MSRLSVFAARLRSLLVRDRAERQLDDELRFHLEMQIEGNIRLGMSPREARYDATRRFGGLESTKREYRERRNFTATEGFGKDVVYAARALRGNPGFTAVAVVTLALGIGINATVFTVTDSVLFKGPPLVYRSHRLLYLTMDRGTVSWPAFQDWHAQTRSFQGMAAVNGSWLNLSDSKGLLEKVAGLQVSTDIFHVLGQKPLLGRDFVPADEISGTPPVAILTYGFWERRYGKDPGIIGQSVRINGIPTTLIAVMPPGFSFPWMQDIWVPLKLTPEIEKRDNRNALWFVIGRLADGATDRSARSEMESIGRALARTYPLTNRGWRPKVSSFSQFFIGSNAAMIYGSMWGEWLLCCSSPVPMWRISSWRAQWGSRAKLLSAWRSARLAGASHGN